MGSMTEKPASSRDQRCENCAAWDTAKGKKGLCRRFPPSNALELSRWFKTKAEEWCLEWVRKER